jgi:hypothetical protein
MLGCNSFDGSLGFDQSPLAGCQIGSFCRTSRSTAHLKYGGLLGNSAGHIEAHVVAREQSQLVLVGLFCLVGITACLLSNMCIPPDITMVICLLARFVCLITVWLIFACWLVPCSSQRIRCQWCSWYLEGGGLLRREEDGWWVLSLEWLGYSLVCFVLYRCRLVPLLERTFLLLLAREENTACLLSKMFISLDITIPQFAASEEDRLPVWD